VHLIFCVFHQKTQGTYTYGAADFFHKTSIASTVTEQSILDHKYSIIQILASEVGGKHTTHDTVAKEKQSITFFLDVFYPDLLWDYGKNDGQSPIAIRLDNGGSIQRSNALFHLLAQGSRFILRRRARKRGSAWIGSKNS